MPLFDERGLDLMRKRMTGFLLICLCIFALSACSKSSDNQNTIAEDLQKKLFSQAENDAQTMDQVLKDGSMDQFESEAVVYAGLQGWQSAKEELGEFDFTTDSDNNGIADCFTEKSVNKDKDGNYIVTLGITGSRRDGDFVVTYNKDLSGYESFTTNVNYTDDELLKQAGQNTLLGMGITFGVLILLSIIIALFGFLFNSFRKKKKEGEEENGSEASASEKSGAGSVSTSGQSEDAANELVAVITAAVAAFRAQTEPGTDPDAFVVRKIRRIRRKSK